MIMENTPNNIIEYCYDKFDDIIDSRKLFENIDQFLILFSCGKDCSMMLDLFEHYYIDHELSQEVVIFSAPFPKHMYYNSDETKKENFNEIVTYWRNRKLDIKYIVPPYDDFGDNDKNGCKICKKSRKSVIDEYVNTFNGNTGILTGFTMYDALSYLNMIMLNCNFNIDALDELPEPLKSTTTKMLHKMSLRESLPNGKYMIRPVLPFNEQEVKSYLHARQIPYLNTPCKISKYKFKRLYSAALDIHEDFSVTYSGIEKFLLKYNISLNNGGLAFDDVENDNYFIDC